MKNYTAQKNIQRIISFVALFMLTFQQHTANAGFNQFNQTLLLNEVECYFNLLDEDECGSIKGGVLNFPPKSDKISDNLKKQLSLVADEMRNNPACRVVVTGHGNGNKIEQQMSWQQVHATIEYMVNIQKIDRERFIFKYAESGTPDMVDLKAAGLDEEGPSSMPAPFQIISR